MTAVDILFAVVGAILALAALYLLVPAVAALFYQAREPEVSGDTQVVVLIPAHDEEGLDRALRSGARARRRIPPSGSTSS